MIQLDHLRVERTTNVVLHDVSWKVLPGEHWVILGPNGCGKTSLLHALTGYMIPTQGEMQIMGRTYGETDWRELRHEIGLVSANLRQRIEEGESGREIVAGGRYGMINFWGKLTRSDKSLAAEWLERVGCGALARRPWAVFSQGERQRVLIARALIARPKILILDEPCDGLDPVARERFLEFIENLSQQPECPSLVLVTHHVEEIGPCFTHGLIMREGRVVRQGPLKACLTAPVLSEAFGVPVGISKRDGRWHLRITVPRQDTSASDGRDVLL